MTNAILEIFPAAEQFTNRAPFGNHAWTLNTPAWTQKQQPLETKEQAIALALEKMESQLSSQPKRILQENTMRNFLSSGLTALCLLAKVDLDSTRVVNEILILDVGSDVNNAFFS